MLLFEFLCSTERVSSSRPGSCRSAARSRSQGWPSPDSCHRLWRCQATPWRRRARREAGWSGRLVAVNGKTWSWTGPWVQHAGAPHHLVSGRARWPDTL